MKIISDLSCADILRELEVFPIVTWQMYRSTVTESNQCCKIDDAATCHAAKKRHGPKQGFW